MTKILFHKFAFSWYQKMILWYQRVVCIFWYQKIDFWYQKYDPYKTTIDLMNAPCDAILSFPPEFDANHMLMVNAFNYFHQLISHSNFCLVDRNTIVNPPIMHMTFNWCFTRVLIDAIGFNRCFIISPFNLAT